MSTESEFPWPTCGVCEANKTTTAYRSVLVGPEGAPVPMCAKCALFIDLPEGKPLAVASIWEVRDVVRNRVATLLSRFVALTVNQAIVKAEGVSGSGKQV